VSASIVPRRAVPLSRSTVVPTEMIFGTYSAQRAADDGLLPHTAAHPCGIKDLESVTFLQVTCGFLRWGGWDSNPGPADYESAALTG
jgi:hypothetical protein